MSDSSPSRRDHYADGPQSFLVRVLRQDGPGRAGYWQRHRVEYEPNMNCISVLQKIAEAAMTVEGQPGGAGGLGVQLPGRGLRGLHDAHQRPGAPGLHGPGRSAAGATKPGGRSNFRPMTKFPVIRDLVVDRSRMFACLEKIKAWLPVDSYLDMGPGARQSQESSRWPIYYSKCMTCGCCLEACPQFLKIELTRKPGESDEQFDARQRVANMRAFIGRAGHRAGGAVQHQSHRGDECLRAAGAP